MDELTSKRCRALLESAKADEPGSDALQRTAAALGLSIATSAASIAASNAPGLSTVQHSAATNSANGALTAKAWTSASLATKLVSMTLVLAGGSLGIVQLAKQPREFIPHTHFQKAAETRREATDRAAALPPAPSLLPILEVPDAPEAKGELPLRTRNGAPDESTTTSPAAKVSAPQRHTKQPRTPVGQNDLEREMALLSKARTALNASDPARCLSWLDEHRRLFSAGVLEPEARVLRERAEEQVRSNR